MVQSFGQEFYPHEAIRALRLAEKCTTTGRHGLSQSIAAQLPQASDATRHRIASKFIQRYLPARGAS